MKSKNKPIVVIIILLIMIIAVNTFFIIKSLINKNKESQEYYTVFDKPDKITVFIEDKAITELYCDDTLFERIIDLNALRGHSLQYFNELFLSNENEGDSLCIEYGFDIEREIALTFALEKRLVSTDCIKFILTGENNGILVIETEEGSVLAGKLNPSAELIETVRTLLE